MINLRRLSTWAGIFVLLIFVGGCAERPFLTKDNSCSILKVSPEGVTQKYPIQLSWNSNAAVMQKLLLEASFVLSDLHTLTSETLNQESEKAPLKPEITKSKVPVAEVSKVPVVKIGERTEAEVGEVSPEKVVTPKKGTILLEANFPQAKKFNLLIDDKQNILDISSIQIEVEGDHPGQVIINQTMVLQGIPNTNLQASYEEFTKMLNNQKKLAN